MFGFMYYVGELYFKKIGSLNANKYGRLNYTESDSHFSYRNNRNQQLMKDEINRWLEKMQDYHNKNKFIFFPTLNNKIGNLFNTSYLRKYIEKEKEENQIILNSNSQILTLSYIFGYISIPVTLSLVYIYSKKR